MKYVQVNVTHFRSTKSLLNLLMSEEEDFRLRHRPSCLQYQIGVIKHRHDNAPIELICSPKRQPTEQRKYCGAYHCDLDLYPILQALVAVTLSRPIQFFCACRKLLIMCFSHQTQRHHNFRISMRPSPSSGYFSKVTFNSESSAN